MFAINDQTLLSGRLDRYLRWAAWAQLTRFLAGIFVWYCYYLTTTGRTSPLQHLSVRILLGVVGAVGAFGGTLLWEGMWTYWKTNDTSSKSVKGLWFFIMTLFIVFGCAAYYHLVYRQQVEERRLARE